MKSLRLIAVLVLSLLSAALAPADSPRAQANGRPLLVIVSASLGVKNVSVANLRRVFQGLPTEFANGKRYIPLNHATGTPARAQFDRAVLALEPAQVGAFWIDRRIRDESPPPRTVPSPELVVRIVASLPGAIAYVYPELLNGSVRSLTIDGKDASQPGYLLR